MLNTKFIFVEGIMGAGKTTTALFLTEQLQRNGIASRFILEGPTIDEPRHPLRVATDFPHPNAVWLDMTVNEFISYSMQKWYSFVAEVQQSSSITVCDGLLFHGNMTDLLLMNAEPMVLYDYVMQVIGSLKELNPMLIYFYHQDIANAIHAIFDARGSAWEAYQINWKVGSPYAVQYSLQGVDGFVQLYRNYRALCDDIFSQLTIPKLAICNEGDWVAYYRNILNFLHVS
jgi:hypothetical protein